MDEKMLIDKIKALAKNEEGECVEFKENWFEPVALGEYISALSNSAAISGEANAYFIWGVNDETHEIVGTDFSPEKKVKGEPLEHFLSRAIKPDIGFSFHKVDIDGKRVVCLIIPKAEMVPTSFSERRFIRIGSSKENLLNYPNKEFALINALRDSFLSVVSEPADYQELEFSQLFTYYAGRGIELRRETFEKNLHLRTKEGKYNLLAQLLSNDSRMNIRVSIFSGKDKTAPLYSVKEFGRCCLLLTLDKILEYGDVLNLIQADERRRVVERKDVHLFEGVAFREAMINAFVHNKWIDKNGPMITIYSDRIEILSRGCLPRGQTREGFYAGESVPVNKNLADIFTQLHISEQSGRGVPKIVSTYGKDCIKFNENSIVVTIPFKWMRVNETIIDNGEEEEERNLSRTQNAVLTEIKDNPYATIPQLAKALSVSVPTIEKNMAALKRMNILIRDGSRKNGHWRIVGD